MYRCCDCEKTFDDDEMNTIETTYEEYYGVADEFSYGTPFVYSVCPFCGSDCYEDLEEYEDELSEDD